MRHIRLTTTERVAFALVVVPAVVVVAAYGLDCLGLSFAPGLVLAVAAVTAALSWIATTGNDAAADASVELIAFLALATGTTAWLLWIARPSWLPLGSGPDLTHHLLLVHYIETHWTLVHEAIARDYLGEMTVYTPGSHVLAALIGAWSGSSGLHVLHPLMAAALGLKIGLVFLIALRVLPTESPRVPLAVAAALSVFAAQAMLLGSFLQYSFYAQVIAELFAVAMWWAIAVWSEDPTWRLAVVIGLLGAATFLSWPLVVGPPMAVLGLLAVWGQAGSLAQRLRGAAIATAIAGGFALLFTIGRSQFAIIAGAPGSTVAPAVAVYGWPLLALSTVGILLSGTERRARPVAMMATAVLAQAAWLYWFARAHNNVPYMAQKMFFLLLYAQGVAVAVALGRVWSWIAAAVHQTQRWRSLTRPLAWIAPAVVALAVLRPLAGAPQSLRLVYEPAVTAPLERAGLWAASHLPRDCVDSLVPNYASAYWLHLAVLGNPRAGQRTGDSRTYDLTPSLVRWLTPGGVPYAIVDVTHVPRDVANDLDVIARFDDAVVARRRGPSACASAQPIR